MSPSGYSWICDTYDDFYIKCPFSVGQFLWVKETHQFISPDESWRPVEECHIVYKATDEHPGFCARTYEEHMGFAETGKDICYPWRPSIFMPRKYSRLTLEITNIGVERVREITEDDSIAEGSQMPCSELPKSCQQGTLTERCQFSRIWDAINKKNGFGWSENPWVFVIEFKVVEGK